MIERATACASRVTDTQKKAGDLFVHIGTVEQGSAQGRRRRARSTSITRAAPPSAPTIRRRICCTRRCASVLGDHVAQKGSLVAPDRLRFDFSHPKPMTPEEIEQVEDIANDIVLQNAPVDDPADGARRRAIASGAMALFGEKYGDEVRVVAMGDGAGGQSRRAWSVELCGGTHVRRTGDIGLISGLGESAVAAGVRRIEALTGATARKAAITEQELR